jgi:hypothetical protein
MRYFGLPYVRKRLPYLRESRVNIYTSDSESSIFGPFPGDHTIISIQTYIKNIVTLHRPLIPEDIWESSSELNITPFPNECALTIILSH